MFGGESSKKITRINIKLLFQIESLEESYCSMVKSKSCEDSYILEPLEIFHPSCSKIIEHLKFKHFL